MRVCEIAMPPALVALGMALDPRGTPPGRIIQMLASHHATGHGMLTRDEVDRVCRRLGQPSRCEEIYRAYREAIRGQDS